jgi:SLT domain-containing protein
MRFYKRGLELARKTWMNFAENRKNVWYQPDVVFAKDGAWVTRVVRKELTLWTLPFAWPGR